MKSILYWIGNEVWEKINLPKTYQEIKLLGKKYGKRFFWAALVWEVIEDGLFPFISWLLGVPELIPVFLVMHFEPISYPAIFWGFRMWDRYQGIEPWEPDRSAHSSYWRSTIKVLVFQLSVLGWLSHLFHCKLLIIFAVLMSLFGFIHERVWHDSNYGIRDTDDVQCNRSFAKTGTYLLVSSMVSFPLLRLSATHHLWQDLIFSQLITGIIFLILETIWSKSLWGVVATTESEREHENGISPQESNGRINYQNIGCR